MAPARILSREIVPTRKQELLWPPRIPATLLFVDSPFFESPQPWSADRPHTVVVACSDGRFHQHLGDFMRNQVSKRPDFLAVPGGPAAIDAWASSFDHARVLADSLAFLIDSHDIRSVWLVGHEGCMFYRKKHPDHGDEELEQKQVHDLRRARAIIAERWPQLEVMLVFARVRNARVRFVPVEPAGPE
jgi:hypothetical protein